MTVVNAHAGTAPSTIVVRWPGGATQEFPLHTAEVFLGRSPENDIVLDFPTISLHHMRLNVAPSAITVTDLNSTNGTLLRGKMITPNTPQPWQPGDMLRVGDVFGNSISLTIKGSADVAIRSRPLGMQSMEHLTNIMIGRDTTCQVVVDHPSVSWHHAEITRSDGGYEIRDLGSTNGTYVNGQRITGALRLDVGSTIMIGPYQLIYDGQRKTLATTIHDRHRIDMLDLGVRVKGGRSILNGVTMSVRAGEFVALVGGSGAGKSTLLKAMNGYNHASDGRVLIDGVDLYANLDAYRSLIGYVPQDDIIHKELPARSALRYAARLRLPDARPGEIEKRVDYALQTVDMSEHADKPVKVMSGGQRKRISIAVELLAQPDILFLDEPTSGLDPGLEKKMMFDLGHLADEGCLVVLVTHATANIEQCDFVTFLSGGRLAYYGPPVEAIPFFKARDFADIYLKLSLPVNPSANKPAPPELQPYYEAAISRGTDTANRSLQAGALWSDYYRQSPQYQKYIATRVPDQNHASPMQQPGAAKAPRPRSRDSLLRQLFILTQRKMDLLRHDLRTLFVMLCVMPLIGLAFMAVGDGQSITGLRPATNEEIAVQLKDKLEGQPVSTQEVYTPSRAALNLIFVLAMSVTQIGIFTAAFELVRERSVYQRERAVNLSVGAYVLSKLLVQGIFTVFNVTVVMLVISLKVDFGVKPIFSFMPNGGYEIYVTLLLAMLASNMLGLFISAVVPTIDSIVYVILVQFIAQIILSGMMFPLPNTPVMKMAATHLALDAIGASTDVKGLNAQSTFCRVVELPDMKTGKMSITTTCNVTPMDYSRYNLDFEHTRDQLLIDWGGLVGHIIFWGGLTVFFQARRRSD